MPGKQSILQLVWDHEACTLAVHGTAENYDLAIAMCDTAKRDFTRRLNAALAAQTLKLSPSETLPFLKRTQ